eukprot:TRINITY_DN2764_c0_g1_i1.p1 TRINITY_DN2764_c0_g1~~TRINITY_DN2764_c0_g1_i1.p1  ORF type:complete len:1055 (+),score=300.76 TRINITY_DN2764_c0_g1_i1:165-3329(+)
MSAPSPTGSPQDKGSGDLPLHFKKEGWLKKEGKRRYFVLSNTTFTWFVQPLGKAKGTIELRNYSVTAVGPNGNGEEATFKITPLEKDFGYKSYVLFTKNVQEMKEWVEVLKKAKNSLSTPTLEDDNTRKGGWLEKKGKKRWFVLRDDVLYWFNKEMSPTSDFLKHVQFNGYLDLRLGCLVEPLPLAKLKNTFGLRSTMTGANYILTAKDETEMKDWIAAIDRSIQAATLRKKSLGNSSLKTGWLIKQGKRMFCTIVRAKLLWYLSEKDEIEGKPKGHLDTIGCDVMSSQHLTNKFTFLICTQAGIKHEFQADNKAELEEWINAVRTAMNTSETDETSDVQDENKPKLQGWLSMQGRKRYFVLFNDSLVWFSEMPDFLEEVQKSHNLNLSQNIALLTKHIGNLHLMKDITSQVIKDRIKDVKTLFNEGLSPSDPKGNITLAGCTVVSRPDEYTFAVNTSVGTSYFLRARSVQEMQRWVNALREGIAQATLKQTSLTASVGSTSKVAKKSGWLMKKGQPRWFLVVNDILVWFDKEQANELSRNAKGSLSLSSCSISGGKELTGEKFSIVVSSEHGKTLILTAKSMDETEEWITFLKDSVARANTNAQLNSENFGRAGWVTKKFKRRWLVLKNDFLMWYTTEQGAEVGGAVKGSITLAACTVSAAPPAIALSGSYTPGGANLDEATTFIVKTGLGVNYRLTVATPTECRDWIAAIQASIDEANQESERHYVVASQHQKELVELILAPNLVIPATLMKVYQSEEVVTTIVRLFYDHNEQIRLLNHLIYRELISAADQDERTLFRGDSVATKSVRAFFKLLGLDYLKKVVGPFVHEVVAKNDAVELDPVKLPSQQQDGEKNLARLKQLSADFLEKILGSVDDLHPAIRHFLNNLKKMVEKCFPKSKLLAVGSFMFLRFICPSIFSPEGFKIITEPLAEHSRRSLILVSKVIQSLANGVIFQKEQYMVPLNGFIEENKERFTEFLDKISEIPPGYDPKAREPPKENNLRDLALITRYLDLSLVQIENDFEKDARFESISAESKQKNRERIRELKRILSEM